jgi:hypothetical protein
MIWFFTFAMGSTPHEQSIHFLMAFPSKHPFSIGATCAAQAIDANVEFGPL